MIPSGSTVRPAGTLCTALLHTRNIAVASRFYGALFGWDVDGDEMWASFTVRGQRVAEARRVEHGEDGWLPLVGVDDVDITTRAAVAAGGTSIETAASGPDGTPLSVIADPDGAIFGVCATSGRHVATLTEGPGSRSRKQGG
jgi:predicted enzyme related to lactoylglutathione lyase